MEYKNGENRIYAVNDEGVEVGEVTFVPTGEDMFIIDHTGVDDAARGQGIAQELVFRFVRLRKQNLLRSRNIKKYKLQNKKRRLGFMPSLFL
ncbi:GNAT family N-acetyltransferase [Listeria innocua]